MPKTLEAAQEELPIDKKARYSNNFIKTAGEDKIKKYAGDLGVKAPLELKNSKKLISFVEEFQAAVSSKSGIAENFNLKLLSDGYFGPHTLKAAEFALKISASKSDRLNLQGKMTRTHAKPGGPPEPTTPQIPPPRKVSRAPKPSHQTEKAQPQSKPSEKLPKDLDAYMDHLRSLGFKAETFVNANTGYRVCMMAPPGCNRCKAFLPGDGGLIENMLNPKGSLIKTMDQYWQKGGKMALVFIEGRHKNDKIKKYANLDQPGNFKSIIDQAQKIAGVEFKNIEISGYSQGGFGIKGILTARDLYKRITRIFVNDGVWNPEIAAAIKAFAAQDGKIAEVAIGRKSAYSAGYFKGSSPIHVHFNKGAAHGAMLGKHMSKALATGEGRI